MAARQIDGWFNTLFRHAELWVSQLALGLIIFLVFWLIGVLLEKLVSNLSQKSDTTLSNLLNFFGRAGKLALTLMGVVTALGTIGIDISALVAGLGLTGFALGFALKDAISNLLAGALIILYKPFGPNDYISVTGMDGTVVEINLRYTVIVKQEGQQVLIPNSLLFTNSITLIQRPTVLEASST